MTELFINLKIKHLLFNFIQHLSKWALLYFYHINLYYYLSYGYFCTFYTSVGQMPGGKIPYHRAEGEWAGGGGGGVYHVSMNFAVQLLKTYLWNFFTETKEVKRQTKDIILRSDHTKNLHVQIHTPPPLHTLYESANNENVGCINFKNISCVSRSF